MERQGFNATAYLTTPFISATMKKIISGIITLRARGLGLARVRVRRYGAGRFADSHAVSD